MRGLLDRIEDGRYAVILIEELQQELVLPVECLPEGSRIHSWFKLVLEGDEVISISLDTISLDTETQVYKEKLVDELMQGLRKKQSGSRFKRK